MRYSRLMRKSSPPGRRTAPLAYPLVVALTVLGFSLSSCAPGEDSLVSQNTFEWYAQGCVKSAQTAQGLYRGADSPIGRQVAEKGLDALVSAGDQLRQALPADLAETTRLDRALQLIRDREPLTTLPAENKKRFERNKKVILHSVGEVGEICKSIFAGFDSTRQPSAPASNR